MLSVRDNRKSRSKSPGGRDRDRSHSRDARAKSPPKEHKKKSIKISISESESEESDHRSRDKKSSKKYYSSESEDDRRKSKRSSKKYESESEESDRHRRKSSSKKSSHRHDESSSSSSDDHHHSHSSKSKRRDSEKDKVQYDNYAQPAPFVYAQPVALVQDTRPNYHDTRHMSYVDTRNQLELTHSDVPDHRRVHSISAGSGQRYAEVEKYRYAQPDPNIKYKSKRDEPEFVKAYNADGSSHFVEIKPESKSDRREEKISSQMAQLSVGGSLGLGASLVVDRRSSHEGGRPPASPLLEAYRGTYQSISPMPSPLMIANHKHDSDLSDLDLSDTEAELKKARARHRDSDVSITIISPSTTRKKVSFYDPSDDAKRIAAALAGTNHPPKIRPLIQILPALSTEDILALRIEYKNHAKVAGQGINIAKHIKMRVPGNLGKAAYATALGRWESEAYWANSWYQGGASRRELLIESLVGRTNSDIREIKNCFKDKRYGDDLEKCMKAELKADKFRVAILLILEERRMSDSTPLDIDLVRRDVADLYRCLGGREGGETAMIQIIVLRSDKHLREVMQVFELQYRRNFAREMITRSKNLVGETLAHILNGALNRPMRDALLLHQAISETAPGKERAELLISRLVRLHWEPKHLERVKLEYEKRYRLPVEVAIRREVVEVAKGEDAKQWGEFCIELAKSSSR